MRCVPEKIKCGGKIRALKRTRDGLNSLLSLPSLLIFFSMVMTADEQASRLLAEVFMQ